MDLGFSPEQEMLRGDLRAFLAQRCPPERVRDLFHSASGFDPELWGEMARRGGLGLPFPATLGGRGGSYLDLAVALEEAGRALLPSPLLQSVGLVGLTLLESANAEQQRRWLPLLARGNRIATVALTEPRASYDPAGIRAEARPDGVGGYHLHGTKLFVDWAAIADDLLVVAREPESTGEERIVLGYLDAHTPGLTITSLHSNGTDRPCELALAGAYLAREDVVAGGWPAVERLILRGALGRCLESVGGAQAALERTVAYAKERVQFGQPIGSFQAVQHALADVATAVDGGRYATYRAVWLWDEEFALAQGDASNWRPSETLRLAVAEAKAACVEMYKLAVRVGQQIHGGVGFVQEHPIQFYYRRAKGLEASFGDVDYQRDRIAAALLGAI